METEEFEFSYSHKVSRYSIRIKRFLVGGEVHLWALVKQPGAEDQIFNFYETADPRKLCWHPMNDKRDDLMQQLEKPLAKKLAALRKKNMIQTYAFYD